MHKQLDVAPLSMSKGCNVSFMIKRKKQITFVAIDFY